MNYLKYQLKKKVTNIKIFYGSYEPGRAHSWLVPPIKKKKGFIKDKITKLIG